MCGPDCEVIYDSARSFSSEVTGKGRTDGRQITLLLQLVDFSRSPSQFSHLQVLRYGMPLDFPLPPPLGTAVALSVDIVSMFIRFDADTFERLRVTTFKRLLPCILWVI